MPIRISGQVYGDLTGSIFEPQVKSIANVDSGTLSIAHGGTGLGTPVGPSGSALVSDGTSLVYATVAGGGGISSVYTTGSISGSGLINDKIDLYPNITLNSVTASLFGTASYATQAATASYITASNIASFTNDVRSQFSAGANLIYTTGSYALNSTLDITAVSASSGVSASLIRFPDGSELTSSNNLGGGISTVYTGGNVSGSGISGDSIGLKQDITLNSVTASVYGTASYASVAFSSSYSSQAATASYVITALTASYVTSSNIASFTNDVRAQFSQGSGITISSGQISLSNNSATIGNTTVALGSTVTTIDGLTSVTSIGFTGSLNGNATTATDAVSASYATNALTASYVTSLPSNLKTVTLSERLALTASAGNMVYQTDGEEGVYVYKSSGWIQII
jgi:hypothetical protein